MPAIRPSAFTRLAGLCALSVLLPLVAVQAASPADAIYVNGYVYAGDAQSSVRQALAVQDGRIEAVGTDAQVRALAGPATRVVDLDGRVLMPGLVDGHMHPLEGGQRLIKCNLNYERLTVAQLQERIQKCLDDTRAQEPDAWLEVVNWFREAMIPNGVATTTATLDALKTRRPILVGSSFGHTALVNTRALKEVGIDAHTPDPAGGRIDHDASGNPDGVLEDAAYEAAQARIPKPTAAVNHKAAVAALAAMNAQGVTSFLDAEAGPDSIATWAGVAQSGELTARAHFAVLITPELGRDPAAAIAMVKGLAVRYDQGKPVPQPQLTVRNVKLFMDGVITAPALTGAMLEPYFTNTGTAQNPHWVQGRNKGPEVYFPPGVLAPLLLAVAGAGFDPHMHADGDAAVHGALNGIEAMRAKFPESQIRAAIAHDEMVTPADFPRYAPLGAIPVLSFQWEKRAPDTVDGEEGYMGPERYPLAEPAGLLAAAGARIAYGSDWPVDPLNEWFALKVGATRENDPSAGPQYAGRLGKDPGLTIPQVIRAITANSAYELHADDSVGSLERGKLADFIVLDRNIFTAPAAQLADVHVLLTVVGGRAVYGKAPFAAVH